MESGGNNITGITKYAVGAKSADGVFRRKSPVVLGAFKKKKGRQ